MAEGKADVSVVMPHYNGLSTVARSIESVIAQTVQVSELVIVDDASADFPELEKIIARYADRLAIRLISLTANHGAAAARNIGVAAASSMFIAFLDSDDVWHPEKIKTQYAYMQGNSVQLTAHGYIYNLNSERFIDGLLYKVRVVGARRFIWGNPIFTPTVMARRESFLLFDERHRRMEDYRCWYENLKNGNHILICLNLAGGYKSAIGESGLTGSVRLMHESYLSVLHSLRHERKMPLADYMLAVACEYMKYPLRSLLVFIRKSCV